jgi:hypothetical protein
LGLMIFRFGGIGNVPGLGRPRRFAKNELERYDRLIIAYASLRILHMVG